MVSTSK